MNGEFASPPPQPGEQLHIDRAHGFEVIQPVGWRVADEAEIRIAYDPRNWRQTRRARAISIESMTLPNLVMTVGPRDDRRPGDSVIIEVFRKPDTDWSPLDHVSNLLHIAMEWVHFDVQVLEAPARCVSHGLPAARTAFRYTALPVDANPVLCRAHAIIHRRGPDMISLTVASAIDGGIPAPGETMGRLLASFRILDRAEESEESGRRDPAAP